METYIIELDNRSKQAKSFVAFLSSLDFLKIKPSVTSKSVKRTALEQAIEDVENGDTIKYGTFEDYLKKTKKYA
ncbi:MAG: hypothetical protein LBQ31_08910 [Bacteroidales bacterium]|jgi:hypothetical protein|nr:hypothetical protein [Bacteroidales bacterium]